LRFIFCRLRNSRSSALRPKHKNRFSESITVPLRLWDEMRQKSERSILSGEVRYHHSSLLGEAKIESEPLCVPSHEHLAFKAHTPVGARLPKRAIDQRTDRTGRAQLKES
jgi:hypothetical protein